MIPPSCNNKIDNSGEDTSNFDDFNLASRKLSIIEENLHEAEDPFSPKAHGLKRLTPMIIKPKPKVS